MEKKKIKIAAILMTIAIASTMTIAIQKQYTNNRNITLAGIEAMAQSESGGGPYSCTASTNCYDKQGRLDGSISCTGTVCKRGKIDGGLFGTDVKYVECDGLRTTC